MKTLSKFKAEMRDYFKLCVDPEEGETFADWFETLMDALREDGKVVKKGRTTYIVD